MSRPLSPRGFSSKNDSAAHDPTASQPGSLTASLYRYLSVTLWMLSNDYSGLRWPDGNHESMKLQNEQDMARLSNWANRIYGIQACLMSPAPEKSIKFPNNPISRRPYYGNSWGANLPEDCYDTKTKFPIRGISFKDISKALLSSNEDHALLLITDACKFPNVMKLPFVLMVVNGQAYWEKTEFYGRGVVNRRVLHYASTTPDGFSYGSQSVGGFFTSAMCNFALEAELILPERSMGIQQDMDDYQRKISKPNEGQLAQQHRVYSSEEFDLYDKRIFEKFGFFHNPVASELGGC